MVQLKLSSGLNEQSECVYRESSHVSYLYFGCDSAPSRMFHASFTKLLNCSRADFVLQEL